jgi:hypothetical protein
MHPDKGSPETGDHKSTSSDRIPCHRRAPEKSQDKDKAKVTPNGRATVNFLMRDTLSRHAETPQDAEYRSPSHSMPNIRPYLS